jgi:methionyl-tRNA formyltransferase
VLRVAFAGTPEFALPALAALKRHHELVGVLTQPDRPQGRGRRVAPSPVKSAALAAAIPLAQPVSLKSESDRLTLAAWRPDVLVVVAYGLLLPPPVLTLPRLGCVNIHASLLPRWRGAAPIQRAILAGDTESGVSIMRLDEGLDTGPVLGVRRCPITREHTAASLGTQLAELGAEALIEALEGLEAGTLRAVPQAESGVSYAPKIAKSEARIDWLLDAFTIERHVRAFNPWPIAETTLRGEQLRIYAARAENASSGAEPAAKSADPGSIIDLDGEFMRVACGKGVLNVTEVQSPGRRPVGVRDFSHSHELAGERLG